MTAETSLKQIKGGGIGVGGGRLRHGQTFNLEINNVSAVYY